MELDFERTPPFPSFNAIGNFIDNATSDYFSIAKANAFFVRYSKACDEIKELHARSRERIQALEGEVNELKEKIVKWESQRGKGRRPDKKIQERRGEVLKLNGKGYSNCEVARQLGVSEGTIRKILKQEEEKNLQSTLDNTR
jgi:ATP/maltotriose-dependent transcriptional regulator MalT